MDKNIKRLISQLPGLDLEIKNVDEFISELHLNEKELKTKYELYYLGFLEELDESKKINVDPKPLGEGTYGTVYKCTGEDKVLKELNMPDEDEVGRINFIISFLKETLIQYILSNCWRDSDGNLLYLSNREPRGIEGYKKKLAPSIYQIYQEDDGQKLCIVMEKLDKDVHDCANGEMYINNLDESKRFLESIALDLKCIQNLCEDGGYSHRDLKLDNIMFNEKENEYYLIDFGFSCFKCNGLQIINYDSIPDFEKAGCNNQSSDLVQLSYNIQDVYDKLFPKEIIDFCKNNCNVLIDYLQLEVDKRKAQFKKEYGNKNRFTELNINVPAASALRRHMLYDVKKGDLTKLNHIDGGREMAEAAKNYGMNLSEMGIGGWGSLYPILPNIKNNTPSEFLKKLDSVRSHPVLRDRSKGGKGKKKTLKYKKNKKITSKKNKKITSKNK